MMYLLMLYSTPLGVLKSKKDAEELIEFYCFDSDDDPDDYSIIELPILTAQPPL